MSISGFEYAQARLQARHAARPDELGWRHLHASASLEHFLESCRRTGLGAWIADVHSAQDAHHIERALCEAFRSHADEVASWVPAAWQPAVRAGAELPELPFIGGHATDLEPWRSLWPRSPRGERAAIESWLGLLERHRERMQTANANEDGWRLRAKLQGELEKLFRRRIQQPVTPLCYLALVALDLAAATRRALAPGVVPRRGERGVMGLKPQPARWFEALAARDDLSRLAEVLARTGVVQIESEQEAGELYESPELGIQLEEYDRLARRYHPYWPSDVSEAVGMPGAPGEVVARALEHVRAWSVEADPVIARLESAQHERAELTLVYELLAAADGDFPDFDKLRAVGPTLAARLFVLPHAAARHLEPVRGQLVRRVQGAEHLFVLIVDSNSAAERVEQSLLAARARPVALPDWLDASPATSLSLVESRLDELDAEQAAARRELVESHAAHELAVALADLHRLRWFLANVPLLPQTRNFAVVTGWTSDRTGATLRRTLEASGVKALVHFPAAPLDRAPPIVLDNPRWVKPFEAFAGMLGTPAQHETDPSPLLAVIAPLLFGFMFGDVGQGFVLLVAGLLLRKRLPVLRLLIPGGIAAMAFGVLFGGVFARHDLLPALWVHPLSAPLQVLGASVLGGVGILLLGLVLSGVQARWQRRFLTWLATDAALIAIYLGLLGVIVDRRSLLVALGGVVWHVLGSGLTAPEAHLAAAASATGHLIERTLQLFVNTVSFARVGAFALAHAGLSTAIAGLSHAAGGSVGMVAIFDRRQRVHIGARRAGRIHPDDAPGAVRVLRALPQGRREAVPSTVAAPAPGPPVTPEGAHPS